MQSYPKLRANKSKGQDRLAKALFQLLNKTILVSNYSFTGNQDYDIHDKKKTMIFFFQNNKEL